jgi:hypothetical protein
MRPGLVGALVVVAAISAVVGGVAGAGGGADARPAELFVAPGGSDDSSCRSRRRPCGSLNRAYQAARPGEVVEVAGGDYPAQEIVAGSPERSSRHVVIRPAKGAAVTLEELTLGSGDSGDGPRHLTIRGIRTAFATPAQQRPVTALPGTRDVDLRDLDAGNFTLWGVQDVRVLGGDWGPCHIGPDSVCSNAKIDAGPAGHPTRGVVVHGATFHDYRFGPQCWEDGADCHFECMYVNGSRDVTIRRSTFRDCALFDVFVTVSGPDAAAVGHQGLTIENNWFDTPWDESGPGTSARRRASAVVLGWCESSPLGYRDVRIRFNSFQRNTGITVDEDVPCSVYDVEITGNLLAWDGCDRRWTYAHNVWSTALRRGRCSRTDRIAGDRFPYRNAASGSGLDFHLESSFRPAEGVVPRPVCARVDVDGRRRTGRRCDAGSHERG